MTGFIFNFSVISCLQLSSNGNLYSEALSDGSMGLCTIRAPMGDTVLRTWQLSVPAPSHMPTQTEPTTGLGFFLCPFCDEHTLLYTQQKGKSWAHISRSSEHIPFHFTKEIKAILWQGFLHPLPPHLYTTLHVSDLLFLHCSFLWGRNVGTGTSNHDRAGPSARLISLTQRCSLRLSALLCQHTFLWLSRSFYWMITSDFLLLKPIHIAPSSTSFHLWICCFHLDLMKPLMWLLKQSST